MTGRSLLAPIGRYLFVLTLPLVAVNARAADPREAARAHYARGLTLAAQNGYEAALREFTEAYAISPQFAVLYNIGQAHVALGHPVEAIAALSKYLHDGRDRLPPGRREQVQTQIASLVSALDAPPSQNAPAGDDSPAAGDPLRPAALEIVPARPPTTTLAVRCAEPGVKIALDGRPVDAASASRGIAVTAGSHRLMLNSSGRRAAEQTLDVAPGSAAVVICPFLPPPSASPERRLSFDGPPLFVPALPPAKPFEIRASTVGIAIGIAGLALEGGALGLYLWNRGQVNDADAQRARLNQDRTAPDYFDRATAYNEQADSIHRASLFTVGLAMAGGVALAGGFYLWQRARTHETAARAAGPPADGIAVGLTGGAAAISWSGSW